jgi:hypothetical protein
VSTIKTALSKLKVPRPTNHEVWYQRDDGRYLNRAVSPALVLTADEVDARAAQIEKATGVDITLVFVDYVSLAAPVSLEGTR